MVEQILIGIGLAIVGVVSVPLFSWLRKKSEEVKFLRQTQVDDLILDALEMGVSNIHNSVKMEYKEASKDGKLSSDDKENLKSLAIAEAEKFLKDRGISLGAELSAETISTIIRRLVDEKEEEE